MKSFKEFQENTSKLPSLGGGGGGTDSYTEQPKVKSVGGHLRNIRQLGDDSKRVKSHKDAEYPVKLEVGSAISDYKRRTQKEEVAAGVPTNSVGAGNIAGTKPAGDDPPVNKKKNKRKQVIGMWSRSLRGQ